MTVTWLIGNGFDLNLGLKTRYTDFYPTYVADLDSCEGDLLEFKRRIQKDYDSWANFELALGENSGMFDGDDGSRFRDCVEDFANNFAMYLEKEVKRVRLSQKKDKISKAFVSAITEPWKYLENTTQRTVIKNRFEQAKREQNTVNFVVFNYTNTVEKCLEMVDFPSNWKKGRVLHIHGTTEAHGELIIGVDNLSQIKNLKLLPKVSRFFIKSECNAAFDNGKSAQFTRLVRTKNNSNIREGVCICLYGLSLGDTDKSYYSEISADYIVANGGLGQHTRNNILVFDYSPNIQPTAVSNKRLERREAIKAVFDGDGSNVYVGLTTDMKEEHIFKINKKISLEL